MAITCGFYNSLDHDRKYDAREFGQLFDGIIRDGIFMSIGTCFMATADGEDMGVIIGAGHAWFNQSWTNNDSPMALYLDQSEVLLDRIDTIVIEVNGSIDVRDNTVKIIKGTPSSNAVRPELVNDDDIHQYPICDIFVGAEVDYITQADITNRVGTEDTPFVTGILETVHTDELLIQWQDEFRRWFSAQKIDLDQWTNEQKTLFYAFVAEIEREMSNFRDSSSEEFYEWFADIKGALTGDTAGNLLVKIEDVDEREFAHHFELTSKRTEIFRDKDDNVSEIIETDDESTITTSFEDNLIKVIIVPTSGKWDYVKNIEITMENGNKVFNETYYKRGKSAEVIS